MNIVFPLFANKRGNENRFSSRLIRKNGYQCDILYNGSLKRQEKEGEPGKIMDIRKKAAL
jgi:hypothetical protein